MTNEIVPSAATARLHAAQARSIEDWQNKTLPFVQWGIGILAVIVFLAVMAAGWTVLKNVETGSTQSNMFAESLNMSVKRDTPNPNAAALALSAYQAAKEQDRAGVQLLTHELLRFSSFLVGAALCFVGSIFIMGKFSDLTPATATAESASLKATISTASPGLFALTAGAALVCVSVFTSHQVIAHRASIVDQAQTRPSPASGGVPKSLTVETWEQNLQKLFPDKK